MNELRTIGTEFFVPFFNMLWSFLDTPFLFGITLKNFILGYFLINLGTHLLTRIFGIGSGGVDAYKSRENKRRIANEKATKEVWKNSVYYPDI